MKYRKRIYKYASWTDIFQACNHKTFNDQDTKSSKSNYVKKTDRSEHKWAFTFQEMKKVIDVFMNVLLESLLNGEIIETPLGTMDVRRKKVKIKRVRGKVFKQLNTMNYSFRLYCVGNKYANRSITRVLFNYPTVVKMYEKIEEDTSLVYKYAETN